MGTSLRCAHFRRARLFACTLLPVAAVACGGAPPGVESVSQPDGGSSVDAGVAATDSGGSDAAAIAIQPGAARVTVSASQAFTANVPVAWSVVEPNGGVIDASGTYVAPGVPGVFHVLAQSGASRATAVVTVVPRGLDLVAGQLGGDGNADDVGAKARFQMLDGAWFDGGSMLYVVDWYMSSVRALDLGTGTVTTLAGGRPDLYGAIGTGCADGVGSAAQFNWPTSISGDGAGNLYVADAGCRTIRRISIATHTVTTFAGTVGVAGTQDGVGTAAQFTAPYGVGWGGDGVLFVADATSIRQLSLATGAVTTLAWTAGQLQGAVGLAYDGDSTLYVSDWIENDVCKVDLAAQTVSVLAGQPGATGLVDGVGTAAQFSEPWGIALDGGGSLFVVEQMNDTIRRIDLATANVTLFAGHGNGGSAQQVDGVGTAAGFMYPSGLVSDGAGHLLVAEDDLVRSVDIATAAVTGIAGLRFHASATDGVGGAATFEFPSGAALDLSGNLLVADEDGLRRVRLVDGEVTTLPADASGLPYVDPSGALYVAAVTQIVRVDGATVTPIAGTPLDPNAPYVPVDGVGDAARFNWIHGITGDGAGHLYVTDEDTVRAIDLSSARVTTIAGTVGRNGTMAGLGGDGVGPDALFANPWGIALQGDDLYVSDLDAIRHLSLTSLVVTTVAGSEDEEGSADGIGVAARFANPAGLSLDGTGGMLIGDSTNGTIRRLDLTTSEVTTVIGSWGVHGVGLGALPARLNEPAAALALPGGDIVVVESTESAVLRARY